MLFVHRCQGQPICQLWSGFEAVGWTNLNPKISILVRAEEIPQPINERCDFQSAYLWKVSSIHTVHELDLC